MAMGRAIRAGAAYIELTVNDSKMVRGLKSAEARLQSFGRGLTKIGGGMAGIGAGLAVALKPMIGIAADAEEGLNRFNAVFGEQSAAAEKFAQQLAEDVGRSVIDIRDSMSSFQGMFIGLGFDPAEARKMSEEMQALALDFASFNNLSDEEAAERFLAGLSGSGEVFDRFGINIKDAALSQKLFDMGLAESTRKATEQQKALARTAIIAEAMGKQGAIGDAVTTADSFSNQLKRLAGNIKDAKKAIGDALKPMLAPLVKDLGKVVKAITEWAKENPGLVQSIVKIVAAVGILGVGLLGLGLLATGLSAVFGLVGGAITLILSPFGLAVTAALGLVAALKKFGFLDGLGDKFGGLGGRVKEVIEGIKNAFRSGQVEKAVKVMWLGIKREFLHAMDFLKEKNSEFAAGFKKGFLGVVGITTLVKSGQKPSFKNLEIEAINQELKQLLDELKASAKSAQDQAGGGKGGPDDDDLTRKRMEGAQANIGAVLGTDTGTRALFKAFRFQGQSQSQKPEEKIAKNTATMIQQLKEMNHKLQEAQVVKDERT